jgi:hypothetical protein
MIEPVIQIDLSYFSEGFINWLIESICTTVGCD